MGRISRDKFKVEVLNLLSRRSTCLRRQVGAILTKDERILMSGYNGVPKQLDNCCDTQTCYKEKYDSEEYKVCLHAEQNIIAQCARLGISTDGAELYVNSLLCMTCAKLVLASGIRKVIVVGDDGLSKVGDEGLTLVKTGGTLVELWDPEGIR